MQVEALVGAIEYNGRRNGSGREPELDVIVPFTVDPSEVRGVTATIREVLDEARGRAPVAIGAHWQPRVGTMIETPRAALLAHRFAEVTGVFSYGANDLSELVFGIDESEDKIFGRYLELGWLADDPFETLDEGVRELIERSVRKAREVRPELEIGIASEHASYEEPAVFFHELGCSHISCQAELLPVARLVGAKAVLRVEQRRLRPRAER